ncbi:hypothetical protein PAMP_015541 [Pampus punctatissimus]
MPLVEEEEEEEEEEEKEGAGGRGGVLGPERFGVKPLLNAQWEVKKKTAKSAQKKGTNNILSGAFPPVSEASLGLK